MRTADIRDYFRLGRIVENPWEVLRFRKRQRRGQILVVRLLDGRRLYIRGGRHDYHIFNRIYVRDEYRLDEHGPGLWECLVDLGANVGLFATRAASLARRVICYEPVHENLEQLRRNVQGWENIVAVPEAVNGRAGTIRIYHPESESATGAYSKFRVAGSRLSSAFTEVHAVTLDELFARHQIDRCDLLKLDVEGAEYDILYAASDESLARIRRIRGEYHNIQSKEPGKQAVSLAAFLQSKGFETEIVPKPKKVNNGLFFAVRNDAPGER